MSTRRRGTPAFGRVSQFHPLVDNVAVCVEDDPFRTVYEALDLCQGRGIDQLSLSINDSLDALEITLAPFRPDGGVGVSVRGIHYFA